MIMQAARDLNLDLRASWLIGDSTTDLETAKNAGVKSALVRTGYAGTDGKFAAAPGLEADSVLDALRAILDR
jgi:histidinol phosphatase-like enzyme